MKATHMTRSLETPYPFCSAGYGKAGRSRRQKFTTDPHAVTCKTCQKMLVARQQAHAHEAA